MCLNHFAKSTPTRSPDDGFIKAWSTSEMGSVAVTSSVLVCKVPCHTLTRAPQEYSGGHSLLSRETLPPPAPSWMGKTVAPVKRSPWHQSRWKGHSPALPWPGHLSRALPVPGAWPRPAFSPATTKTPIPATPAAAITVERAQSHSLGINHCLNCLFEETSNKEFIARAAVTKFNRLGGFNNKNVFSHSSGGWTSEIKVSAGLVSSQPLSVACRRPPSHCGLTWFFLYTCLYPNFLFL